MEGFGKIDVAHHLLAGVRRPRAAIVEGIAGQQQHRPALQPRQACDDRAAEIRRHLEERALVDHGVDDRPHLVDLAAVARHRFHQRFLGALRIVLAGKRRRQFVDRRRQIGQEAPGAGERFLFGIDRVIDAAGAGLDFPAAQFLLAEILAEPFHHRRAGDEHRRAFGHHRIMAGRKPRRAQPRDRAEPQAHHRHARHVRRRVPVPARAADAARQVGGALGLDGFYRAAAAGAFDHADDRQPEIVRHLLGHQRLCRDRRVRRAAAHGKIVADHDHRAAIDLAAAEHAVRRRQVGEFAVVVIFADAGNRADLVEGFCIDQLVDALADGEPALVALPLDLVNASHLARERFAAGEVVEFRLPVHSYPPT